MRVAIVGAKRRRPVDRRRAAGQRPHGHADREGRPEGAHPRGPGAEWVQADACEVSSLEEAQLATCDVVVAATGDDKANLVVSLLAKTEFAVNRVVARVKDPRNEWLYTDAWECRRRRLHPARARGPGRGGGDRRRRRPADELPQGCGEPGRDHPRRGHPVGRQGAARGAAPRETVLTAILRGDRVITPTPDEPLEAGDELLFVTHAEVEDQLKAVLAPDERSRRV